MTHSQRRAVLAVFAFVAAVGVLPVAPALRAADTLPARLSDQEFWRLTEEFSEANGYFRSDNLLSNETYFQIVIPDLVSRTKPGGVYLGVGPEQNFTYIAAIKPKIAFITDIRRGNLHLQLMYKALFELSADRADFIGRLFTKKRPGGLSTGATVADLFSGYWQVETSAEAVYRENLKTIQELLTKKHGFPLSTEDLAGIEYVYSNFYWFGPSINYNSSMNSGFGGGRGGMVSYADLMMQSDGTTTRSYLASEANYKVVKDLQERNLIVPVVGNFAGPKALRAEGKYLKDRGATVTAFYLSNVEMYLNQDGMWMDFCHNVAMLPLDESSTFIRSSGRGGSALGIMATEVKACGGGSR